MASLFSNRLAPYERRVIELLRNSKDKRARKLAKKRVRVSVPPSPYKDAVYTYPRDWKLSRPVYLRT